MVNSAKNKFSLHLSDSIAEQWSANIADRCSLTVGLSGGLDSVVLLHALAQLRERLPIHLSAVHVHHGLSVFADNWLQFCQQLCQDWSIPLHIEKVQVQAKTLGLEAAARVVRYQAYSRIQADVIVLAHHADDQIETFFLAGLRGGGLRALSAMPSVRHLNKEQIIWRPLLKYSRQELQSYAQKFGLQHIEDDSNTDTAFLRNWLRLEGLPIWRERLPTLDKQIQSTIHQLQDELSLIDEIIMEDWGFIHTERNAFQVSKWQQLSFTRQRQQLRQFALKHQLGTPRAVSVQAFATQLMQKSNTAEWSLPNGRAVYYDDLLWPEAADINQQWSWLRTLPQQLSLLTQSSELQWVKHPLGLAVIKPEWTWRCLQKHDWIRLQGGSKNVRKLLQDRKIPAFMRQFWPVICDESNQCIAVVNIAVAADLAVQNGLLPLLYSLPIRT